MPSTESIKGRKSVSYDSGSGVVTAGFDAQNNKIILGTCNWTVRF